MELYGGLEGIARQAGKPLPEPIVRIEIGTQYTLRELMRNKKMLRLVRRHARALHVSELVGLCAGRLAAILRWFHLHLSGTQEQRLMRRPTSCPHRALRPRVRLENWEQRAVPMKSRFPRGNQNTANGDRVFRIRKPEIIRYPSTPPSFVVLGVKRFEHHIRVRSAYSSRSENAGDESVESMA